MIIPSIYCIVIGVCIMVTITGSCFYFLDTVMAKKAKKGRIKVVLQCTESGQVNYVMKIKKDTFPKEVKKYCRLLRKHTMHKIREKMK
ncbi:MAG: 50S ribosomal protein L33 [Candidatus Absconditabacterales bacterium]|nr:50S ribosomal protein L33 [Candidatus Absconditabacterales bacterium]